MTTQVFHYCFCSILSSLQKVSKNILHQCSREQENKKHKLYQCIAHMHLSLSTILIEIVWLPKISCFKNQPCNKLYPKKPAVIHWLSYNGAVSWLNEVKTRIFQPTANFEIFKIYLYFVCLPACLP